MKTVFNDISTIAHLYANKLQDEARNSSNTFYFNRDKIYSYGSHFCIANRVTNEHGEIVILFTERSYSNTTAKHISVVRSAIHETKLYCPYPCAKYGYEVNHADNFSYWFRECEAICKNLIKAKKPEKYLSELSQVENKVKKYADFFGIEIPVNLSEILKTSNKEEYIDYTAKKELFEKQEQERKAKEAAKKAKENIKKWLNFESYRIYDNIGFDLLRFNSDNNTIETSQAVKIPYQTGKMFYEQLKSGKIEIGMHLLNFTVRNIDKKIIEIGCHKFEIKYLLNFGKKLYENK